ncbi:N-acetylgalactosamine-6-sulfatase [Haloferula helveola]|uniref:N-acetylgalactosamine-6-sulfatase n=1 Tax=Haloferula helveola TaxID=490095 RepID=A0ABM7RM79_9BACT|nr:N-acetylgalactosamine-6-sulfatase [Haloferula helveola]
MRRLIPLLFALSLPALAADRPNLLVFLVDDMGLMDSSVPFLADTEGKPEVHPLNKFYRTPSMERLAKNGIRFETFYANSVCSPTRISIMTGQSSARHHTTQWIRSEGNNRGALGPHDWKWEGITEGQQTLPGVLREGGYHTIYAGKAHFGPIGLYGEFPSNFGFDVNIGGCSWGQPGSYYGKDGFGWIKGNKSRAVPDLKKYHGKDIYLTEALTEEMNSALTEAAEGDKPFFAYMAYYAVHAPFQPNKKYIDHYEGAKVKGQAKTFATMIESMDTSVGQILDHLNEIGAAENTFVIFLGDNGTDAPLGGIHEIACAAPLRGKKGTHYEGGMRVPFIAGWAKPDPSSELQKRLPVAAGTLSREAGNITDIFPTLLDLAGVDYKQPIDGADLKPALGGGSLEREPEFLMHFPHDHRSSYFTSYRLGDWKLIYHYNKPAGKRCELFNLAKDRTESDNLADKEPEVRKRMIEAMAKALEKAGAQYPLQSKDSDKPAKPVVE